MGTREGGEEEGGAVIRVGKPPAQAVCQGGVPRLTGATGRQSSFSTFGYSVLSRESHSLFVIGASHGEVIAVCKRLSMFSRRAGDPLLMGVLTLSVAPHRAASPRGLHAVEGGRRGEGEGVRGRMEGGT